MRPASPVHEQRSTRPARRSISFDFGLTTSGKDAAGSEELRSSFGTVPGAEFPAFVYISVLAAFVWIMLASWLAFAGDRDAALSLGMAVVLGIVFFALPIIIREVAVANSRNKEDKQETAGDFLSAPVETATGQLRGSSAWLQVLIIPLALALAATLIGAVNVLVR
ncbi:MAG: hypothetical protein J2P50_00875 [Hyphomicrobiaceae bacterium]|nr:hypothetical protein [Hyphomicrobiaceae bacterium]